MKTHYIRFITTAAAAPHLEEALMPFYDTTCCFEAEESGVSWLVEGYSAAAPDKTAVEIALELAAKSLATPFPTLERKTLEEQDWVTENQRNFPPIRAGRFFIHGSHFSGKPPRSAHILQIDAATAFGTGEHATTKGCLLALQWLKKRQPHLSHALDVGTGSGVLAMGVGRLWQQCPVIATDIDPLSIVVAEKNARLNQLHPHLQYHTATGYTCPAIARHAPYPLILSNILARPLCALAPALNAALQTGGYAILSGLLSNQRNQVYHAHFQHGLRLVKVFRLQNWDTLLLQKK